MTIKNTASVVSALFTDSKSIIFYPKGQEMLWGVNLNKVRLIEISR